MPIPVCTIDDTGIHAPPFNDILTYLKDSYRAIYGQDVYLENDSQDGQLLGIFAAAVNDANAMAVAVYNAFSPSTAQGEGLSRVVKINGIKRAVASKSTVDLVIIGQTGTTITNGAAQDTGGNRWNLPASVTIPPGGSITVTAQAQDAGAIAAGAGTVTQIVTPTLGWQSVNNPSVAVAGAPIETDAALRQRQTVSTALPSLTVLEGIIGAVASLPGVSRHAAYENDTDVTDANGIPSHSISLVVQGGDASAIAGAIAAKKGAGAGTYGTTSQTVADVYGIAHVIKFYRPTTVPITYALKLRAFSGYTTAVEASIKQTLADWTISRAIGEDILLARTYLPAQLNGAAGAEAFEITEIKIARDAGTPGLTDLAIAFNEAATATIANVTITVVP